MAWDLSEGELSITVSPETGGELSSVRWKGAELLYKGGSGGWRGGTPWLFPAVGRTKGGRMPIHGLVLDRRWTEDTEGGARVCRLWSDAETRAGYPFDFVLTARYRVTEQEVSAELEVEASGCNEGPMPFSAGNHLSLAFPDAGACVVRTEAKEVRELTPESFLSGATRPADLERGVSLKDDPRLADLVLGGFAEDCWVEVESQGRRLRVSQAAGPENLFVLWADQTRRFLCVEPWYGGPDSLNTGKGLLQLWPGSRYTWGWELRVI